LYDFSVTESGGLTDVISVTWDSSCVYISRNTIYIDTATCTSASVVIVVNALKTRRPFDFMRGSTRPTDHSRVQRAAKRSKLVKTSGDIAIAGLVDCWTRSYIRCL